MKQKSKQVVGQILENVDDFHAFLVLVIPALREWVKDHSAKGVREQARALHEKLGIKFEDAREAIEAKHEAKEEPHEAEPA